MPLPVYRLRRILAVLAIVLTVVIVAMYFYARSKATNVLKTIPGKMGYDIKQTASGFQFSKSDGKRTLFTVQASDVKEFKLNGNAELHKVSIILYGRDSSRFDQIYGEDFAYNQKTGEVSANGEVQIDLVANPAGLTTPDQSTPRDLKNPIHLKTRDLVFNRDTGNALTNARVEFQTAQASGWAMGVEYTAKNHTLTLISQIHVELSGSDGANIDADRGVITSDPRQVVLEHPRMQRESGTLQADQATFYIGPQNQVERIVAEGNITTKTQLSTTKSAPHTSKVVPGKLLARAERGEFLFSSEKNLLRTATLTGNVHVEESGSQPLHGDAGRVVLDFAGHDELQTVHAVDGVHLIQASEEKTHTPTKPGSSGQLVDLTAPAIDFTVAAGRQLRHAETSGSAQIVITSSDNHGVTKTSDNSPEKSVVTAGKFAAEFASSSGRSYLASVHGAPNARIVNSSPEHPERISTSDAVDARFLPTGGIESLTQTGALAYSDGETVANRVQAWADSGRYTPSDQVLQLTGNPRVVSGGMQTTADVIRMNRASGEARAEGNVKSTYSDLKEQPGGALFSSSSPIHVTSRSMSAGKNPVLAVYTGNVRLWQDANVIEAPSIQFDRDRRSVKATATPEQPVQTVFVQPRPAAKGETSAKPAPETPISIKGQLLTYIDAERRVHYEGGVIASGSDFTATAKTLDAYLLPKQQNPENSALTGQGRIDRMIAEGDVKVQQPNRRAEGQKLTYIAAEDKFVLTGGPPSIFDAEHGKITGVSLTFFRRDDRVLVEGEVSSPVVTTTRVAH